MFAGGMRAGTLQDAPFIVGGYPWPDAGVVCDVAGGVGTLLAAVLDARPGLRGVFSQDAPGVLAEADGWLAGRGLRERVKLAEGDIFRSLDAEGRRLPDEEPPPRLGRPGLRHDPAHVARGDAGGLAGSWSSSTWGSATRRT